MNIQSLLRNSKITKLLPIEQQIKKKFSHFLFLVKSDLYRYHGKINWFTFFRLLIFHPGFKITFWKRACKYLHSHPIFRVTLFPIARLIYHLRSTRFGVEIPFRTEIGPGLYIGHYHGIVIHHKSVIGKNCNLMQGITIGSTFRGEKKGVPVIGDNAFIGSGAKVVGNITVGNHVAVGANCVVLDDVPDNGVVVGIPGKVVSDKGSEGYLKNLV